MKLEKIQKIALGGGCHWCTEAVFQSLNGVIEVDQGYVASTGENNSFSEAVIVHFNPEKITLKTLIEIHLRTHKSTSNHSMREKYRSAIYYYAQSQKQAALSILKELQTSFEKVLITSVLPFSAFTPSREELQNYYQSDPEKPFCKSFIDPKLEELKRNFSENMQSVK